MGCFLTYFVGLCGRFLVGLLRLAGLLPAALVGLCGRLLVGRFLAALVGLCGRFPAGFAAVFVGFLPAAFVGVCGRFLLGRFGLGCGLAGCLLGRLAALLRAGVRRTGCLVRLVGFAAGLAAGLSGQCGFAGLDLVGLRSPGFLAVGRFVAGLSAVRPPDKIREIETVDMQE